MIVDEVVIKIYAGKGGDGRVAFNKNMMQMGPVGGIGGDGGNVYIVGINNITALNRYRYRKVLKAEDGKDGGSNNKDGACGKDITITVPLGTTITDAETGQFVEILKVNQPMLIAKGGQKGRGNFFFRSSTNTTPKIAEKGKTGENRILKLELRLIADVGIIGLPNAGKSSLLNALTNASSKVANYAFTTLEPNLGDYQGLILADIPGIIEGASSGKGLGIKFLKHIERTKVLFHCISGDSMDLQKDYQVIRKEITDFHPALGEKQEYLFLTKSDNLSEKEIKDKLKILKKCNPKVIAISILDDNSIDKVKNILNGLQKEND
ncbi:MAG: GTPase ObgE [bacterium]